MQSDDSRHVDVMLLSRGLRQFIDTHHAGGAPAVKNEPHLLGNENFEAYSVSCIDAFKADTLV